MIEPNDEIYQSTDNPQEINDRIPLKGGKTAISYLHQFQDSNSPYYQISTMAPEEWLSLFADKLYEKYLKINKTVEKANSDILDSHGYTWFIHILFSSGYLPRANWYPVDRKFYLTGARSIESNGDLAPRPAVRRIA